VPERKLSFSPSLSCPLDLFNLFRFIVKLINLDCDQTTSSLATHLDLTVKKQFRITQHSNIGKKVDALADFWGYLKERGRNFDRVERNFSAYHINQHEEQRRSVKGTGDCLFGNRLAALSSQDMCQVKEHEETAVWWLDFDRGNGMTGETPSANTTCWLFSKIFFSILGGLYISAANLGFGKHIVDLDALGQMNALHVWFFTDIFSTTCTCLLRLAAGYHILRHVKRSWQRSVVYIGNTVNIIYSFFLVFVLIFRCKPLNWFWQRTAHMQYENGENFQGVCRSNFARHGLYAESVMSALVDWSFASLPLILMRYADIGKMQRAAVSLVILLGQA
jgi:hypothetical protein